MSKVRFSGYIHSIVGHQIMVSPNGSSDDQFKCALDDFESIMPSKLASELFTFHVKRDRIGVEHYRRWLGMEKIEIDRLANLENGLLQLIDMLKAPQTKIDPLEKYFYHPEQVDDPNLPSAFEKEFAASPMTDKVR